MQRFDWPSTSSEESTLEHPRSSKPASTTVLFTITTMGALTAALMNPKVDIEPMPTQAFTMIPEAYEEAEPVHLHSGPFTIEGYEYPISFLDDGFTLMAGEDRLRMQNVQAYFSNVSLDKVHALLGAEGISSIECGDTLVMHSGKRSLHIPIKELVRIIETARNEQTSTVTIADIPYKLKMENGLSTCLIPRHGNCTIEFQKLQKKTRTLLASGSH